MYKNMNTFRTVVPVKFFIVGNSEPVREWLRLECSSADRLRIGKDIRLVQTNWPIGMPTCRPLGEGLFEVRSDLEGRRIARVFFGFVDGTIYILHAIIKKTQKTPVGDLALARTRLRDAKKGRI